MMPLRQGPQATAYSKLLCDFQAPTLRDYPISTMIAAKYQAMVMLGEANSRIKASFDLTVIARQSEKSRWPQLPSNRIHGLQHDLSAL